MTQGGSAAADSLRAVLDSVFAGRDYNWVEKPDPLATVWRWLEAARRWLTELGDTHPLLFRLILIGLLLLVLATFAHAGWVFLRAVRSGALDGGALPEVSAQRRDQGWFRREADRLAAQGRYAEAIQADFLALVLALDGFRLLKFHPGKTPAEYGMEARLAGLAREEFRELVRKLYGYAFARRPCGPADFAAWRAQAVPERYAPTG